MGYSKAHSHGVYMIMHSQSYLTVRGVVRLPVSGVRPPHDEQHLEGGRKVGDVGLPRCTAA